MPPRPKLQAITRKVEQAARHAARRKELEKAKFRRDYDRNRRTEAQRAKNLEVEHLRKARRERKEDYELGPLAPKRAARTDYGTITHDRFASTPVSEWRRKWCGIEIGDRVVLLKGVDKGKIGQVTVKEEDSETFHVKDLNMAEIYMSDFMRRHDKGTEPIRAYNVPTPWQDVRLVYPLPHPVTGELRDVIIENLERRELFFDEETLETEYARVIPELDHIVPWPDKEPVPKMDHDGDTPRITVEERTWLPTLNEPPFPESVINELRNKESKYRVPNDERFLSRQQKLEERQEKKNIRWLQSMRTPLQELHALRGEQRRMELRDKGLEAQLPEIELRSGKPWKWKARPREEEPASEEFLARIGSMLAEKSRANGGEVVA